MRLSHALAFALALALPALARAQAPTLSIAGELSNPAGEPVTAKYAVTFRLYSEASGGAPVWQESGDLDVAAGRFNALLGLDSPLDPTLFSGGSDGARARFLGIVLPNGSELAPRLRVSGAPIVSRAARADDALKLEGREVTAFSPADHDHDAKYLARPDGDAAYSPVQHVHDGRYARPDHKHDGAYSPIDHRHDGLYAPLGHDHDRLYAKNGHSHAEYAPAAHDHDTIYVRKAESDALHAKALHDHDDRYYPKGAATARFLTATAGDDRYYTRTAAAAAFLKPGVAYTRTEADGRFLTKTDAAASFLTTSAADSRYVPLAGPTGAFTVGGNLKAGSLLTLGSANFGEADARTLLGGFNADALHTHLQRPDLWCPGFMANGMCVADYRKQNDASFITAAQACARLKADIATDSQMHNLRYTGSYLNSFQFDAQNGNTYWTNSFADNDSRYWDEVNAGTGDDHSWNSGWAYACVYNITPPAISSDEMNVGGVRVTYVHNVYDTDFRGANRACFQRRSDLCSDAQYGILREAGVVSVGMWSSSHSDADGSGKWVPFQWTSDDPSPGQRYGFACCATARPLDLSCPGEEISGVCTTKIVNDPTKYKKFLDAAKDCAATNRSHLCSIAHSAVLRQAGRLTPAQNWTESHSDNDSGNAFQGVGPNMPDDPDPNSAYGYACCL